MNPVSLRANLNVIEPHVFQSVNSRARAVEATVGRGPNTPEEGPEEIHGFKDRIFGGIG
jgi:hypothetical protein